MYRSPNSSTYQGSVLVAVGVAVDAGTVQEPQGRAGGRHFDAQGGNGS